MAVKFLKLQDENTELCLIGYSKRLALVTGFELSIGDVEVKP